MSVVFLILSLFTASLTLFIPLTIAIPLAILSVLLFTLSFRKLSYAIFIPLLFSIFFITPVSITHFTLSSYFPAFFRFNSFFPHIRRYSEKELLKADTKVSGIDSLFMECMGVDIRFEGEENEVLIPGKIEWKKENHTLILHGRDEKFEVIAGKLKNLQVKGMGISVEGDIYIENSMELDGPGILVKGNINAKNLELDGSGILIKGRLNCKDLEINGMGIKVSVEATRCDHIEINGMGSDIFISYLIPWEGKRYIEVNGMGSSITVELPEGVSKDQVVITGHGFNSVVKIRGRNK